MTQIGHIKFESKLADISQMHVGAVVVPTPLRNPPTGGIFEAMKNAGAIAGCEALRNWFEDNRFQQSFEPGKVLIAPSGGAHCDYLCHTGSVPNFSDAIGSNFAMVVMSVESSLWNLHQRGVTSVALPLMGTGQMGSLSPKQSAQAILTGIDRFNKMLDEYDISVETPMHVQLCVRERDAESLSVVQEVLSKPETYTDIPPEQIRITRGERTPTHIEYELQGAPDATMTALMPRTEHHGAPSRRHVG